MDVQVRLSLQGGHNWDFCCDEDDPIVFGLVSSLSGSNMVGHGPADGIIQVQTRTGRFYIARASLIGVEVTPIANVAGDKKSQRFAMPSAGFVGGMAAPSPFVLASGILSNDVHHSLLEHALGQSAAKAEGSEDFIRLDLGSIKKDVESAFRACFEKARAAFDLAADEAFDMEVEMFALGNAQALPTPSRQSDVLSLIYQFHNSPSAFTGGGVRLFDGQTDHGMTRASDTFRDLSIKDNALLILPSSVISAGLPVYCPTRAFADGLFAIRSTMRKGAA